MTLPISLLDEALAAAEAHLDEARGSVAARVQAGGRTDPALLERDQFAAHGFAWTATYVAGLREMIGWARRLEAADSLTELDRLVLQAAFGEYLAQLAGGIAISQGEVVRPADLGLNGAALRVPAVERVAAEGNSNAVRMAIAAHLADGQRPSDGLDDESLALVRSQFRRFADERIIGPAHGWHSRDELIPMAVVGDMADMGVFGLTVPEEWGGLGMGKVAMCVVTEELSRGYIGVGSLGTRSEIAAELIRLGGTEEAEGTLARGHCERRRAADRRVHRTRCRLGPRRRAHPRGPERRHLPDFRREDLDYPCGARRPDDPARPHRPRHARLSRPLHVPRPEDARRRRQPVSRSRHRRRRDSGARLSRHEGIRDRLRRLRGGCRKPARARGGPGLQAVDGDFRERPHSDRGALGRRR